MLGRRRRRRSNNKPTSGERRASAGAPGHHGRPTGNNCLCTETNGLRRAGAESVATAHLIVPADDSTNVNNAISPIGTRVAEGQDFSFYAAKSDDWAIVGVPVEAAAAWMCPCQRVRDEHRLVMRLCGEKMMHNPTWKWHKRGRAGQLSLRSTPAEP